MRVDAAADCPAYSPLSSAGVPQANSTTSMPRCTEPIASGNVLPCSSVMIVRELLLVLFRSARGISS